MKQLLIATAALSLIGGAAFAQTTGATPGAYASPGSTQGAQAGTDPSTGANDSSNVTPGATTTTAPMNNSGSSAQMPSTSMPSTSMPSAPTSDTSSSMPSGSMASNTPSGSAPSSYPVCTSKHEDRCLNRSQSTRMANNGMRMHHMKSLSSSSTAPATNDQAQPAATPGL